MEDKKIIETELCGLKDLLEEKFNNLDEKFSNNEKDHIKIIEQTTKTNGSVAKAQTDIAELKIWRGYITGAIAVIMAAVVPALLVMLNKFLG